jgi:mannosyltransferase
VAYPAALVALAALALGLAFHGLSDKSLILDESTSVVWAHEGASGLWRVVSGGDPNGGLYYVLLNAWVRVFGDGETAARALGAIAAILSVPAVAVLGARLFDTATGVVAALLMAVDAFFVEYAQTARFYSLVLLLVVVSSYCFVVELERPSRWSWAGYVLGSSLAVYAHYFAVYVLTAQLLTLLVLRRRAALTGRWIAAALAIAALCVPEAVFAKRKGPGGIEWIPDPRWHDLLDLPKGLAGGSAVVGWCFVAVGIFALVRARRQPAAWRPWFLAAWVAVPVALAFAASYVQPMFLTRYLIVSLPAFALLAAAGMMRLPGRAAGALALAGLVALSAVKLSDWYGLGSREDYRGAAAYVVSAMRPGDRVVYEPRFAAKPMTYYFRRNRSPGPTPVGLADAAPGPATARVWMLTRSFNFDARAQAQLAGRFAPAYRQVSPLPRFRNVGVALFAPPRAS